jgi:RHS repeat-associated protein
VDATVTVNYAAQDEAAVAVAQGFVPNTSLFAQADLDPTDQNPKILLNHVAGGDYYVLLAGQPGAGSGQSFTFEVTLRQFELDAFSVSQASNLGPVTMQLTGSHFTLNTKARLLASNGSTIPAQSVVLVDSNTLTVTFGLTNAATGNYDVQAQDGTQTSTAPGTLQVNAGGVLGFTSIIITSPAKVRVGEPIPVSITAINGGDTDSPGPIYTINATNYASVSPQPDDSNLTIQDIESVIPPNTTTTVGGYVYIPSPKAPHVISTFQLTGFTNPSTTPIDWNNPSFKSALQPPYISTTVWNALYPTLISGFGPTLGTFENALRGDADYLEELGEPVTNVGQLMALEVLRAEAAEPTPVLSQSVDLGVPTPGLPLNITRTYVQSIAGRYQSGDFGYGWTFLGDDNVTVDSKGDLIVQQQGSDTIFTKLTNGTYQAPPGDSDTLTIMNGFYVLLSKDGTAEIFNPNGSFHVQVDSNGNSITTAYTGSQLTSLTHSSGAALTFTYNPQGRIATATASTGLAVTYSYDPSGNYLLSATSADGSVSYSYITSSSNGLQLHALQSITHPDGTHTFFSYDALGRLANQQGDNGTGSLSYAYFIPGGYTVTDATNLARTVLFNENGQPAAITDPSGNTYRYFYDSSGNLQVTELPDGSAVHYAYDLAGNLTTQTDALGNTNKATYSSQFSNLTSMTDSNGNLTTYTNNGQGDLTQITTADGSATQYVPSPNGEVQQLINANGEAISYVHNSFGEVTTATFSNGVVDSFTYDNRGNLLTATDNNGTTMFTYDDPNNPDLVTSVTYPSGMFVNYSYFPGGRLQQMNENGYIVNYSYDMSGRLKSLMDSAKSTIVTYTYNTADQLILADMGNGTYTTYSYTPIGEVASLINYAPNGTVNSEFIYTYDNLGRVATETTLDGTTTYGYNLDSELTNVTLPNSQTITYAYDAMGNRTTVSQNGVPTNYSTNTLNQYTAVGGATGSYDKDGNLTVTTGPGGTTTNTYNIQNRLIGVQTPTDTWTYTYDVLGNLIAGTHNGQTTQYLVSPTGLGNVVGEYDSGGHLIANYTQGLGLVSQVTPTGASYYYNFDANGSTVGLSDNKGTYIDSYRYLPFGEALSTSQSVANPFQYVGLFGAMNLGNGLYFMRARDYSPALGRFTSRDPLGLGGGSVNLQSYVGNNPLSGIDPTGLTNWSQVAVGGIQILAGLGILAGAITSEAATGGLGTALAFYAAAEAGLQLANGFSQVAAGFQDFKEAPDLPNGPAELVGTLLENAGLQKGKQYGSYVDDIVSVADLGRDIENLGIKAAFYTPKSAALLSTIRDLWNDLLSLFIGTAHAATSQTEQVAPTDPNFISGPAGFGSQGFVTPAAPMPFVIGFENLPSADAPAQVVEVAQQLDTNLDWSTFQLGDFGFGGQVYSVPAGRTSYHTVIDYRSVAGVYVDVNAQFNAQTGVVTWTFTSLDPTTLDIPLGDPEEGYLPPNLTSPEGEGWVTYFVRPKAADTTSTVINSQATVFFNAGLRDQSSLSTAPVFNTIDASAPTSSVSPLPATETSPNFTVSWSGQDDAGGSGIASFSVFVSDNGGPFTLWQNQTTQTSAIYNGVNGHTYSFYSVATDNVGNVQSTPASAQATTIVTVGTTTPISVVSTQTVSAMQGVNTGSVLLATFTQGSATQSASAYTATVAWGDGHRDTSTETNSPIFIQVSGQTISVYGSHTYTTAGTQNLSVTLATTGTSATASPTVTVVANVTAAVSVTRSGFRYDFTTHEFVQTITITNTSSSTLFGSLALELTNLSSNATLANASGTDVQGNPFIDFVSPKGQLAAGQSITLTLYFNDPKKQSITYGTQVWQGLS